MFPSLDGLSSTARTPPPPLSVKFPCPLPPGHLLACLRQVPLSPPTRTPTCLPPSRSLVPSHQDTYLLASVKFPCPLPPGHLLACLRHVPLSPPTRTPTCLPPSRSLVPSHQDTYLLATQQPNVLRAELQAAASFGHAPASVSPRSPAVSVPTSAPAVADGTAAPHAEAAGDLTTHSGEAPGHSSAPVPLRRSLYKYRSPTERLLLEVGRFLDATVPRMPQRYTDARPFLATCPPRDIVLDRFAQHTSVCPDSLRLVGRLRAVQTAAWAAALFLTVRRLASPTLFPPFSLPPPSGAALGAATPTVAAAAVLLCRSLAAVATWLAVLVASWAPPLLVAALGWGARYVSREFRFAFSEADRDAALAKVPGVFRDSRLGQPRPA
eukprot:scaffold12246_cov112-Isochrysis_galbana.AAC.1